VLNDHTKNNSAKLFFNVVKAVDDYFLRSHRGFKYVNILIFVLYFFLVDMFV